MNAIEQCRDHIAPPYSDWEFALRGVNETARAQLLGLISFITRINDIPHRASEQALALTQLQWWRAQLNSESSTDIDALNTARHPSLTALGGKAFEQAINTRLQRLLDLVAEDIEFSGFATQNDMRRFFRTRGAITMELMAEVLNTNIAPDVAASVGYFLEYCDILKSFSHHAHSGVVYFSQQDLAAHDWTAEQLIAKESCESQEQWQRFFTQQTNAACDSLFTSLKALSGALKPLRRFCHLRYKWLMATQAHGYPFFRYQLALGSVQKRLICWRSDWFSWISIWKT